LLLPVLASCYRPLVSCKMVILALLLDQMAIMATSLFCGAAVYVSLVEQPARMQVPLREAARQFGKSYPRAALLQPIYIATSCAASATRSLTTFPSVTLHRQSKAMQQAHLVNLVMMGGCLMWTLVSMLPGNKALLAAEREPIPRVKQLLQTWGWKHNLRSVASAAALFVLLAASLGLFE